MGGGVEPSLHFFISRHFDISFWTLYKTQNSCKELNICHLQLFLLF